MQVLEHNGEVFFSRYGIAVPRGSVLCVAEAPLPFGLPVVIKAHIVG